MKMAKRLMAGLLSLVVVAGAMFVFAGCNNVKNKTYAFESRTYTVITALDPQDSTKITETRTLTAREYWLSFVSDRKVAIADLSNATMTEAEEKLCEAWLNEEVEDYSILTLKFGKKTVDMISTITDPISGSRDISVATSDYSVDGDKIVVRTLTEANDSETHKNYTETDILVQDKKLELRSYKIFSTDKYKVGVVLYASNYFIQK